jgi:translocation and assembly module TamB
MTHKQKITRWILAVFAAIVLISCVAGYFYLQSASFRRFALAKIIEKADAATGGRTEIRSLDLDFSHLTARLNDIVVHGKDQPSSPPMLQIEKITVGLTIQSILHWKIALSELLIDRPIAHLQVDRNGSSNLPQPPPSASGSQMSIFDLAVGHAQLNNGEIVYNNRSVPLDADIVNLRTDIRFDSLATRYRGSISYANGTVRYANHAPLPHALNASFTATPAVFQIESANITVASSSLQLTAEVANYSDPSIQGTYSIFLHSEDAIEAAPTLKPAGDIKLAGAFNYHSGANQPFLQGLTLNGSLDSKMLKATVSTGRVDLNNLRGQYTLAGGTLKAHHIEAESLGGKIVADLDAENLSGSPSFYVRAILRGLSLNAVQRTFQPHDQSPVVVSGVLSGAADARWTGSIDNASASADLSIRSDARIFDNPPSNTIPVQGDLHAVYDAQSKVLTLRQSSLRIPATTLTADGQVGKRSHLQLRAATGDLHRLVTLAAAFHPFADGTPAIAGSATLVATIQGELRQPVISAHVSATNLQVQGSEWKNAGLSLAATPQHIVVTNGVLTNSRQGSASFSGTIGLHDWSFLSSSPIQAHISVQRMQIADLQHLANLHYPFSGELSAAISLQGSQLAPRGSGSIEIANARVYDEPLKTATLTFQGDNQSIVSDLHVSANAGAATAKLTFVPTTKAYSVHLDAPAIILQKLRTVQEKNLGIEGTVAISASGDGSFEHPQLTANISAPQLNVKDKSIQGVKANLRVADKRADLAIDSEVAQASIRARGQIDLTGNYPVDASIDTGAVPLGVLLAVASIAVPQGFSGQTEFHATLKGPLKDKNQIEAHLLIPTFAAKYQQLEIGASGPIRADYVHSLITLQPAEIKGTGTSLRVQGSVPIGGTATPSLTAQGSIDASLARMISPDLRSSGTITLELHATGSATGPQVGGQVRLQDVAFSTPSVPLGINQLNGTLDVSNDRVQISNLTGEAGGGQISGSGSITYRPAPQFDLALQAKSVRLLYPTGLRSLLDGNLAWVGTMQGSTMTGRVLVDSLSFTRDFDLSTFADQFSGSAGIPALPGFADTVQLHIAVQSKSNLSATSSQVSLEGTGVLDATGTLADPVITGRTDLTSGELFYRNVRYQLQRGIITFADPNETRPTLDISASTTIEQYNLTLNLRGPFDSLTTAYSSDPPLATADIINLIARGHTSSELAAQSQSTDSMIASEAVSQVGSGVQKLAGISSLQIDPVFGSTGQTSTRVGIQQRVSKNFLFTFSTDVSQPGQEIVEGDYQINKRWSVSVQRDQVGGVAVDGRLHTRF